jgi:hypothetical protein
METVAPIRQETRAGTVSSTEVTNALLACGVASGPFFYTLAIIQIVTRAGGGMVNASPRGSGQPNVLPPGDSVY